MEQENLSPRYRRPGADCLAPRGRTASGGRRKWQSTEAGHRGGTARSSEEGPVMGLERRGRADQGQPGASPPGEEPRARPRPDVKPFEIGKRLIYEAWERVRANKGAPGVDAVSIGLFGQQWRDNLYKLWNRMSSGSYFPGPVRGVEIPKDGEAAGRVCCCSGWRTRPTGWRRPQRRCCWKPSWSRCSTGTAMDTGRDAALMMRWPPAGSGAGKGLGAGH